MNTTTLFFSIRKVTDTSRISVTTIALVMVLAFLAAAQAQTKDDRLIYARAFEAVIWATPFLNTLQMRKELERVGISDNKLAFIGSPPSASLIIPTFNNQTAYVFGSLSLVDGPVVLKIPAETKKAKLFGTFYNIWDDPLADIGPAGLDKGKGGTYVLLPPGFKGKIPKKMFAVQSNTYDVHIWFRSVASTDDADQAWTDAADYARAINLYKLGNDSTPAELVDVTKIEGVLEGNIMPHHDVFGLINSYIQEEPVQAANLSFRGMLKELGIEKGQPYEPDDVRLAILDEAKEDAFTYMEEYLASGKAYVPFWGDLNWGAFRITKEIMASSGTWNLESMRDYHARALDFAYWAVGLPVAFDTEGGGSTFYLFSSTDEKGEAIDGAKTYRLTVPADVPVQDFWSVLLYSTKTRTFYDSNQFGVSSRDNLVVNDDGSVDLYIGQSAPEGFEANLLQTKPDERGFLAFRFYGPLKPLTDGIWKLNDPKHVE